MNIKRISNIGGGQDGAIYGDELFRFSTRGVCRVYKMADLCDNCDVEISPFVTFTLDAADLIVPHSNAVCFGTEFYEKGDKYPLLYTNVYNNYAKEEDKLIGVCLVYRIQYIENEFKSTLVQMIQIGFCEDSDLWKVSVDGHGVRPYGNFVIDADTNSYWAFVMRNEALGTRYFKFDLPSVHDGELDERFNVKKVTLEKEDIREYFDCSFHRFIQGATLHNGRIYSTEGFTNSEANRPAIRVIDLDAKGEQYTDIMALGYVEEPELISFCGDECFYSDAFGKMYKVDFS